MTRQDYPLGHSPKEIARLERQAMLLQPLTLRLFDETELRDGMSVLDIGTGAGDLARLAATIVGTNGRVVGIDREASVIERAQAQADAASLKQLRFECSDLESFDGSQRFDLVIGRNVLAFQQDKVGFVRNAAALTRPGGQVAFIEGVSRAGDRNSVPPVPVWDAACERFHAAFASVGLDLPVGERLVGLFREAGLPEPRLVADAIVGGSASVLPDWLADVLETVQPMLEKAGLLPVDPIEHDAGHLRRAAERVDAQLYLGFMVAAHARPGQPAS